MNMQSEIRLQSKKSHSSVTALVQLSPWLNKLFWLVQSLGAGRSRSMVLSHSFQDLRKVSLICQQLYQHLYPEEQLAFLVCDCCLFFTFGNCRPAVLSVSACHGAVQQRCILWERYSKLTLNGKYPNGQSCLKSHSRSSILASLLNKRVLLYPSYGLWAIFSPFLLPGFRVVHTEGCWMTQKWILFV